MPSVNACACGHNPEKHARGSDTIERCDGVADNGSVCRCTSYVLGQNAPLCFCGHMAGMHQRGSRSCRFERMCGCVEYRAIPPVPIAQIRQLAGNDVVVVVVPLENWDHSKAATEIIAGDLTAEAHIIMVQEGPGLYYVSKHPERSLEGALYSTEETVRRNLLRIQQKLSKG